MAVKTSATITTKMTTKQTALILTPRTRKSKSIRQKTLLYH